jgi:hypothetical protein
VHRGLTGAMLVSNRRQVNFHEEGEP